jgi:salicylate hydroxylase
MADQALIIGGGIGGLSAALALHRVGVACAVFEQAAAFTEVGAGLQLGPNAVRRLHAWGLRSELARIGAFPQALHVRSAASGAVLGTLALGAAAAARYGAPYITAHRADLHGLLLAAVQATPTPLHTGSTLMHKPLTDNTLNHRAETPHSARITIQSTAHASASHEGAFIVGADGLRSAVRQALLGDGAARATGQVVYRALLAQAALPAALRSSDVTVWLGPHLHVVSYPVRGGDLLNVAAIVQGTLLPNVTEHDTQNASQHVPHPPAPGSDWAQCVHTAAVHAALRQMCAPLNEVVHSASDWRGWAVYDRAPLTAAQQMAQGRVALLGDAAHPMRPYLAQGAGMAIEDAAALAAALQSVQKAHGQQGNIPQALQAYAAARWQRNAQVQARARRNGELFHATGLLRLARDAGIALLGRRVLDVPWLYGG